MTTPRHIDEEAANWVVRLDGTGLSKAERRALADWIGRSPDHAASLARARASWVALGQLRPGVPGGAPPARLGRRHFAKVTAVLLVAAVATSWVDDADPADHRTARGEVRRVALPDGSQIILSAESAIRVSYDDRLRRVDLLAGEALFAPAAVVGGETRPFTVFAGAGRIRAIGTRFTVTSRGGGFDVAVLEHGVEVSFDQPGANGLAVVRQAQGVHYDQAGIGEPYRVDTGLQAAWTEGRLVFDRMTLADVVDMLNRYRPGRIVLASPTLAARRVSGIFRTDLAEIAFQTIVAEVGAYPVSLPLGTVILF